MSERAAANSAGAGGAAVSERVLREAAEWYARLRDETAGEAERARWREWLAADPAHALAWEQVQAITRRFGALPGQPARDALQAGEAGRRRALKALGMLALGGVGLWASTRVAPWHHGLVADHHAGVGQIRDLRLADGTRMWLNTATALDVAFSETARMLHLRTGEVLVEPAADARPLTLATAHGRLQPLGTRFNVRLRESATELAVLSGRVRARPAAGAGRVIEAGTQCRLTRAGVDAVQPLQHAPAAWTRGVLIAEEMPLGEVVAELARHRHGHLGCEAAVADLRVVGTFPLSDTDRALEALAASLPVTVHRPLPWWVSVGPA